MELERFLHGKLNSNAIAVSEKHKDWSYDSFTRHAFYARDYFIENNISKVMIALPQGFYAYALIWGAYLAETTFCPVNTGLPADRMAYYIDQFDPDLIVEEELTVNEQDKRRVLTPEAFYDAEFIVNEPGLINNTFNPESRAYIIFTSGSTGLPKGVILSRRALENLLSFSTTEFKAEPGDVWGQFSNLGFDLSVCDIFTAIICGATLVPLTSSAEKLIPGLTIKNKKITIWHSVPSVIDLMNKSGHITNQLLSQVKTMIFAGERLFPSQLALLFKANPDLIIYNCYGPTEATIFCTYQQLTSENYTNFCENTVSIGKPLPGYEISLRHHQDNDDAGEIIVQGEYIASGYLGKQESIAVSPFQFIGSGDLKTWSYATGDFAKYHNDNLYYISRKDSQIKIKGYRVDLTEIDHWLREYGCSTCISVFLNDKITSFVVCEQFSEPEIRGYMAKKLPSYYLPGLIIHKKTLPHNKSGKIDINQLKAELIHLNI
jgi:D-alanine--poly(phosphoribitol) ligase subunit 1